jgi:hypothetical protein
MRQIRESIFVIEYLCEMKSVLNMALGFESGDLGVLFAEKPEVQKSCETVSLNSIGVLWSDLVNAKKNFL